MTTPLSFKLRGEFIELDNLLKVLELVSGGTEAKERILSGAVKVNGEPESRIRRKLRAGDRIEFGAHHISISG